MKDGRATRGIQYRDGSRLEEDDLGRTHPERLPVLMLLMSGVMKLVKPAVVVEGLARLGYPENLALGIGILELACTLVYVVPRTSVLGRSC